MLPGNAGRDVERELLALAQPLASDVLRVAHHGPKSSSGPDFIARVAPKVAIVSADSGGSGNLSNPETLAVFQNTGVKILRTDVDGAMTLVWDGRGLTIHSYGGSRTVVTTGLGRDVAAGAGAFKVP